MATPAGASEDIVSNATVEAVLERIGFHDRSGGVAQKLDMDSFFVIFSGYLVFFMQCGFCMVGGPFAVPLEPGGHWTWEEGGWGSNWWPPAHVGAGDVIVWCAKRRPCVRSHRCLRLAAF